MTRPAFFGRLHSSFPIFLFSLTLFLSATLMFVAQLIIGKQMLPMVGGSPSGWLVALSYFQLVLLAGYAFAHWLTRFTPFIHGLVVIAVLLIGIMSLPLHLGAGLAKVLAPNAGDVFLSLLISLSIPFLGLCMLSPSLQRLFAVRSQRRDPYFLFAASNAGSFIGLFLYPLVVERFFGLVAQSHYWQIGYYTLILCCIFCFIVTDNKMVMTAKEVKTISIDRRMAFLLVVLSFIPSSLTSALTTKITMDGGAIPFFWSIPLAFYLLTLVMAFSQSEKKSPKILAVLQPFALVPLLYTTMVYPLLAAWNVVYVLPYILTFCVTTLFCHYRLAQLRPVPAQLTSFYLYIALG
ncbi:MAG: hypothetical protein WAO98_02030, partial [Alphaproteobacteria bacterium]